jgi:hypothetical protein
MKMAAFRVVATYSPVVVCRYFRGVSCVRLRPDVGGSKRLWNVGTLPVYTAQQL